jgi:hypothetical protein
MFRDIYSLGPINFPVSQLEQLERNGYLYQEAHDVFRESLISFQSYPEFSSFWNKLDNDNFMLDGGSYRQRKFGVFKYDPSSINPLEYLGNDDFYQEKDTNILNGGIKRKFSGLDEDFASSDVLKKIISYDLSKLPKRYLINILKINIHQIRINSTSSTTGNPTPEGIHQDGHDYVAQHLIAKHNVTGGESTIYDQRKQPLFSKTLSLPLQTIFVKDPKVFHGVSPITPEINSGYRDMLLIDFNIAK